MERERERERQREAAREAESGGGLGRTTSDPAVNSLKVKKGQFLWDAIFMCIIITHACSILAR